MSYNIQIGKEARFMIYSWIKEAGLSNLNKNIFSMGAVFRINIQMREVMVDIFYTFGPVEGFAMPLNLKTGGRLSHPMMGLRV